MWVCYNTETLFLVVCVLLWCCISGISVVFGFLFFLVWLELFVLLGLDGFLVCLGFLSD